ncbi:MAG: proton-conducting transporter membrane subunit [Candidatus Methylacidiphilales bacterium]
MNSAVLPFLIPFLTAVILLLWRRSSPWRRVFIMGSILSQLTVAFWMVWTLHTTGERLVLALGGWTPPLGIVLVVDSLSAIMFALSALMTLGCVTFRYASISPLIEHPLRQPLLQFLVSGINLTFITGDLFNLFVAFEIMLIASYALLTLEADDWDVKQAFPYLSINLAGSALFLVAVAFAYGIFGTLNMADMARIASGMEGDPRVTYLGLMLALVFGIKAGIFPLYFWLPNSYPILPASLAALYSGMLTKVGVYVLLRTFTTILPQTLESIYLLLAWAAGFTMIFGVCGAISRNFIRGILSYHILSQIGYMVLALGLFTPLSIAACIFYIIHHIIVKATLFLIGGTVWCLNGTDDLKKTGGLWWVVPSLGVCFLIQALSLAGLPPLSGFWGKYLIFVEGVRLAQEVGWYYYILVGAGVLAGILTLYSMLKIWNEAFWKPVPEGSSVRIEDRRWIGMTAICAFFCVLSLAIGLGAEVVLNVSQKAADMAMDQEGYIRAVLNVSGKGMRP